jgi:protein involved in polysaccharide export with SLBB domain
VATLDLYDLLLSGDTSNDHRLQPGDVIFVPPIGETIGVSGAVRRPAIYETDGKATLADAVGLAGGLSPDAFGGAARLERIDAAQERRVISLDLADARASQTQVRAGDILYVPQVLPDFEETIVLSGHVQRPGPYEWRDGMRLADLISSSDELLEGADTDYIIIRRQPERASPVDVLSANLGSALANRASADNVRLEARDEIHVFGFAYGRQRVIVPILEELSRQATFEAPYRRVDIAGNVRAPGTYPFESGMRVSDLIRAGGNLAERAYTLEAELTRYSVNDGEERATELIRIDLAGVLRGDTTADLLLTEHDHLRISTVPDWQSEWSVVLAGEVRFPGEFRIRRGETLRQVVDRAGGVTDEAFPEGAIFLRESLRKQEQQQLQMLSRRIEADLASLSLETMDPANSETLSTGRILLEQLKNTEAVGRLVISPELISAATPAGIENLDVELMDGDHLMVPPRSQVVTVIGEVQQSTSHLYQDGLMRDDYIEMSGGETRRADKSMIYVVRASGAVVAGNRSNWFGRSSRVEIHPGDTIVVPLETGRVRPLTLWTSITQILYQAAIAVAAVRTFDN